MYKQVNSSTSNDNRVLRQTRCKQFLIPIVNRNHIGGELNGLEEVPAFLSSAIFKNLLNSASATGFVNT